ncbi:TIGR01244 family sulfur transferase [Altererythrobacter litoralis]|uniref:TIGR01244 family sulfur transferase n=1 Tax=Altererythrobacter litoralis TaxID=3113904 RepID=A0ABU7GCL8_9SPHN|nr:TIGR01244 family sulfur transferase [Erythrobacteraceae bacterium 1XM1-14]
MDIRQVEPGFAVAPQLQPGDMAELARKGFVAVICNRPDGEDDGQPGVDAMRAAAESAGLAFHHIPVSGGQFPDAAIDAFRSVRQAADGPVMAYCRTGTRSITLETLANPEGRSASDRLGLASAAGYDLSTIAGRLGD